MFERRSLRWPITLGVVMIVLLVALTVGWVLLAVFGALKDPQTGPLYWTLLILGTTFFAFVLTGVGLYLALSVKAINLNRRQSNFMDSVTHELKSPIASLKLYLQTLNRRDVSPDEQADFFRFMLDDVERLDHLINHLLDAARLDRAPAEGDEADVELSDLLRGIAEEVRLRHRAPAEALVLDAEEAVVHARAVDLDMIFRNIIDNAFKYAGEPTQIEIVSRRGADGTVVTEIRDNGDGVPLRYRHKIFRRFVRVGMELEREKPGTGLGLYIVYTLVQRLRGRVRVRDREGHGTVLEVRLPAVDVDPPNHAPAAGAEPAEVA